MGYAVASQTPLLSWSCEHRGRVLYIDGELPGELLQNRLRELGPPLPETDFMVLSHSQFQSYGLMMPDLATEEGRDFFDVIIEKHNFDLIILDIVSTLVRSGVENDVESWCAIQDWSLHHRARGRAVAYLHHHGRSGNPRGTSSREIVLDSRISLSAETDLSSDTETAFKIEYTKSREFYGADKVPIIAYISTQSGKVTWRYEVAANTRDRVRDLVKEGMKGKEIAKALGISPGRVSQITSKLRHAKSAASHDGEKSTEREHEKHEEPRI